MEFILACDDVVVEKLCCDGVVVDVVECIDGALLRVVMDPDGAVDGVFDCKTAGWANLCGLMSYFLQISNKNSTVTRSNNANEANCIDSFFFLLETCWVVGWWVVFVVGGWSRK